MRTLRSRGRVARVRRLRRQALRLQADARAARRRRHRCRPRRNRATMVDTDAQLGRRQFARMSTDLLRGDVAVLADAYPLQVHVTLRTSGVADPACACGASAMFVLLESDVASEPPHLGDLSARTCYDWQHLLIATCDACLGKRIASVVDEFESAPNSRHFPSTRCARSGAESDPLLPPDLLRVVQSRACATRVRTKPATKSTVSFRTSPMAKSRLRCRRRRR